MADKRNDTFTSNVNVAIILVNWNGWSDSIACIQSCLALTQSSFRIVLCDNASSDNSIKHLTDWALGQTHYECDAASPVRIDQVRLPIGCQVLSRQESERGDDNGAELTIIKTGFNLGFAGGNNVGIRWSQLCGFSHIWLLNNDTVVPKNSLSSLIERFAANENLGLCGSIMAEYHRPELLQGYAAAIDLRNFRSRHLAAAERLLDKDKIDLTKLLRRSEVMYPIGASMIASSNFVSDIGLLEESYFLYYEEADWVLRANQQYHIDIASSSIVYHKIGASAGSTPQGLSSTSVGFLYRSRLMIAQRFKPKRLPFVVMGIIDEAMRALLRCRTGKFIGAWRALTGQVRVPRIPVMKAK